MLHAGKTKPTAFDGKAANPTVEVFMPTSRRLTAPSHAAPESPQQPTTPRIYVLPFISPGSPLKSPVVPAKLDRRSLFSNTGDSVAEITRDLGSPLAGRGVHIDKSPNHDILRDPLAREKYFGKLHKQTKHPKGTKEPLKVPETGSGTSNSSLELRDIKKMNEQCEGEQPRLTTFQ